MSTRQDAIGLEIVLDRSSPDCEREIEVFARRVEAWKRELGITHFVRAEREDGDRVFISLFPATEAAPEGHDRPSASIATADAIESPARSDGFERAVAPRRHMPAALPAKVRPREAAMASTKRARTFTLE